MRYLIVSVIATLIFAILNTPTLQAQERDKQDQTRQGRPNGQRRMRDDKAPKLGEVAPAFKLKSLDGKSEVALASFQDKKPVILIFGSYT